MLLACASQRAQPAFLHHSGPPGRRWPYLQWAEVSHITYKEMPIGLPAAQYYGDIFSIVFPGFQITIACIKLTKTSK